MTLFCCILPRRKALQVTLRSEATAATSASSCGPESPFVCLGVSVGKIQLRIGSVKTFAWQKAKGKGISF